ncbi:MAG: aminotransferase class I/II-fold pyridoxal phosphate-dependent enzyme [Myxococcota bacterium]
MTISQPTPGAPDKHLNLRVRGLGASATVAINERCNALRLEGRDVFKLGLGQSPFPVPSRVVESLREHAAEKDYLPVQGLKALRHAVAEYTSRKIDVAGHRETNVLIGPGSKELLFLLQLSYYGDLVVPAPAWVSYAPQAEIIGRRVRHIPTTPEDRWMLSPEAFERLCAEEPDRPRLLILNYPSNPTGATFSDEALEAIAQVARRYRALVLSDEIYGEVHHTGEHHSIARHYPEGTIVSSGLSKWCGAGGWRLGTFVFPPDLDWLRKAMTAVASETYTSTSAPIQYAAITAFEGGPDIESYLAASRRTLGALGRFCHHGLEAVGVPCPAPEGGFYLFPDFEPIRPALEADGIHEAGALCEKLLQDTGVAILPGSAFGRPAHELTTRLAYVDFDGEGALAAESGQTLDDAWLARHCPSVVQAVERIQDWTETQRAKTR